MLKHGLALLLLLIPFPPATAQKLDTPERFAARLGTCTGCHGQQGIPPDPKTPVISGQTAKYIDARIGDFRKGLGANEEMITLVRDLGRFDIAALSEHFAGKPWPDIGRPPASPLIAQRAEELIARAECTASGCHENRFVGGDVRVAGQQPEYLKAALTAYRNKVRRNYLMEPPTEALTDADIEVLATYLAGLKP